jgi:hypothetical protein
VLQAASTSPAWRPRSGPLGPESARTLTGSAGQPPPIPPPHRCCAIAPAPHQRAGRQAAPSSSSTIAPAKQASPSPTTTARIFPSTGGSQPPPPRRPAPRRRGPSSRAAAPGSTSWFANAPHAARPPPAVQLYPAPFGSRPAATVAQAGGSGGKGRRGWGRWRHGARVRPRVAWGATQEPLIFSIQARLWFWVD